VYHVYISTFSLTTKHNKRIYSIRLYRVFVYLARARMLAVGQDAVRAGESVHVAQWTRKSIIQILLRGGGTSNDRGRSTSL